MKNCWLNNKTVVITGASGGLGFAISRLLIEKYDCKIIGIGRNEEKILKSIETLGDKKSNFTYKLFDVSYKANWQDFYSYLLMNDIKIDVLINNAGFMLPFAKFHKYSDDEVQEIINTNFVATVNSTKILMPLIEQSSTPAIVNIASSAGNCAVVGQSMYCATKYAVKGFTETLQQDYKKQIYIGGIYPGFIRTNIMNRQNVNTKNNKLINKLMMSVEKASKKIVKAIKNKRKRLIIGFDGKSMSLFSRIMPNTTPTIIRSVLKSSHLDLFDEVFKD